MQHRNHAMMMGRDIATLKWVARRPFGQLWCPLAIWVEIYRCGGEAAWLLPQRVESAFETKWIDTIWPVTLWAGTGHHPGRVLCLLERCAAVMRMLLRDACNNDAHQYMKGCLPEKKRKDVAVNFKS